MLNKSQVYIILQAIPELIVHSVQVVCTFQF